jgi:hypothetical protein
MAATMTMARVEGQVRRNHLFDTYDESYRWSPQTVLAFICDAVDELCATMNPYARFDQDTGELLDHHNVPAARALSEMGEGDDIDAAVGLYRALVIPVDDRFEQCIIHLAAAKCFAIDDSDTANSQKSAELYATAERYAQS